MERAIGETDRRRVKQIAFNEKHGITPKGVVKSVQDILEGAVVPGSRSNKRRKLKAAEDAAGYSVEKLRSPSEITKRIRQLEEKMYQHARDLEFEAAGQLRDDIQELRKQLVNI